MTFKEELQKKIIEYKNIIDISEQIEEIKTQLDTSVHCRTFTITLYKLYNPYYAVSSPRMNHYIDIIPDKIPSEVYVDLYRKEIEKMGFSEEDYFYGTPQSIIGDCYEFILRW